jgi:hypothetical protein
MLPRDALAGGEQEEEGDAPTTDVLLFLRESFAPGTGLAERFDREARAPQRAEVIFHRAVVFDHLAAQPPGEPWADDVVVVDDPILALRSGRPPPAAGCDDRVLDGEDESAASARARKT